MAGMLKKFAGHSRQIVAKESNVSLYRMALRRTYGSRSKGHAKTAGLLTCYQIQQENLTDRSLTDRPELPGSPSHELGSGVFSGRGVRVGGSYLPSSIHIETAAVQSVIPEVPSVHSSSSQHFHKRTNSNNNITKIFGSHAVVDKDDSLAYAAHQVNGLIRKFNTNPRIRLSLCKVKNGHLPLCGFVNDLHLTRQRERSTIASSEVHVRHYATRAHSRSRRPVKKQRNYYEELGVTPNATQAQVKAAYFNLSKIYHPDKNAGCKDSHSRFAAINEAYSVLGNLTLRRRYDRGMLSQKDIHGEVSKEEKAHSQQHHHTGGPTYTGTGIPFSEEAKRQAKKMDDFFSEHYKSALEKERREKAERKQRMDEYMEMQEKAKLSPAVLAVFMLVAVTLAVRSVSSQAVVDKKLREGRKEKL